MATPRKSPQTPNVVIVSDLHVGSSFALCPPDLDFGPPSRIRPFLWSKWREFCKECEKYQPFILVVNGDAVEGIHHGGRELVISSVVKQWRAAVMTLRPLVKMSHCTYVTEGTECHTLDDEHDLAEELGCVKSPDDRYSWHRLRFIVNGLTHEVRHHIGTASKPWTELTALQGSMIAEREEAAKAGEGRTDILVSAHRHAGATAMTDSGMSSTSASWQFPTRHVRKVVPQARPCIGGLIYDYRGRAHGEFPYPKHWHKRPEPDKAIDHNRV